MHNSRYFFFVVAAVLSDVTAEGFFWSRERPTHNMTVIQSQWWAKAKTRFESCCVCQMSSDRKTIKSSFEGIFSAPSSAPSTDPIKKADKYFFSLLLIYSWLERAANTSESRIVTCYLTTRAALSLIYTFYFSDQRSPSELENPSSVSLCEQGRRRTPNTFVIHLVVDQNLRSN